MYENLYKIEHFHKNKNGRMFLKMITHTSQKLIRFNAFGLFTLNDAAFGDVSIP